MARERFTSEQIISKLREAEVLLAKGTKMALVCRKMELPQFAVADSLVSPSGGRICDSFHPNQFYLMSRPK